jgi:DNA-binding transcriptional LysR family regulator
LAVAKLERELKTQLLVRGARPLLPTPAGQLAYQAAKDLAVQAENLELRLAELARRPVALRIGMIDSMADALFWDADGLETFQSSEVSVVVNNSRYLAQAVERSELDIAFIAKQTKRTPSLETKRLASEPLVVVMRADRPAPPGNKLPDFIGYDQPSHTFGLVMRALREYGVVPQISFYSTSPEVMLRLVLLGRGIAALPYLKVQSYVETGELRRLGHPQPWLIPRPVVAITRRGKQLSPALAKLSSRAVAILGNLMQAASSKI